VRHATGRPVALDPDPKHTMALGAAWVAEQNRRAGERTEAVPASVAVIAEPRTEVDEPPAPAVAAVAPPARPDEPPAGPPAAVEPVPSEGTMVSAGPALTGRPTRQRGPNVPIAAMAAVALAVVLAGGAFALLPGLMSGGSSASSSPSDVAGSSPSPVASSFAATAPASIEPSPSVPPSSAPPSPSPDTPTPTPTLPPGKQARILDISVRNGRYVVDYEVYRFDQVLPGQHVHFFFDSVPQREAGVPGNGPWILYAGPIPFREYRVSDRPARADRMCILVANPDHSVIQDTGNCVDLPD
jgi:hypothetical protein